MILHCRSDWLVKKLEDERGEMEVMVCGHLPLFVCELLILLFVFRSFWLLAAVIVVDVSVEVEKMKIKWELRRWKGYFCRHTERKLTGCGQRIECENVRRGLMQTCIRILRFYMHFGCVRFHWTSVTAEHRLTIFRTHWHGFECAACKKRSFWFVDWPRSF